MKIEIDKDSVVVSEGGMVAEAKLPLRFGHLGCKRLVKVLEDREKDRKEARASGAPEPLEIPAAILAAFDKARPGWEPGSKRADSPKAARKGKREPVPKAAESVRATLERALEVTGSAAVELWDTMRNGSDYWRPGKGLSAAVATLGSSRASFCRLDDLCPPEALRDALDEGLSWPEYAQSYADWLEQDGRIDLAIGAVALAQARDHLAVFYCTDAYIPGYADRAQWASEIPYRARHWPLASDLRTEGCHRVVLADLLVRRCRKLGATTEVIELDPTNGKAWRVPAAGQ